MRTYPLGQDDSKKEDCQQTSSANPAIQYMRSPFVQNLLIFSMDLGIRGRDVLERRYSAYNEVK